MNGEFGVQISEYKKLLDVRASRIQKLEMAVREAAYSQVQTFSSAVTDQHLKSSTSVHTPSGQSMFEVHIQKAQLTKVSIAFCSFDFKLREW